MKNRDVIIGEIAKLIYELTSPVSCSYGDVGRACEDEDTQLEIIKTLQDYNLVNYLGKCCFELCPLAQESKEHLKVIIVDNLLISG